MSIHPNSDWIVSLGNRSVAENRTWHDIIFCALLACVASVSVEFGSKERPRNGVFGILPTRKMGREPKKERWG